jgi:hypothetical protein
MDNNDWRLLGQERYLTGVTLIRKRYADKLTNTDHDHCEFCGTKFSDTIPGSLIEGYTTSDDYRWICDTCYNDFKQQFKWRLTENA